MMYEIIRRVVVWLGLLFLIALFAVIYFWGLLIIRLEMFTFLALVLSMIAIVILYICKFDDVFHHT